MSLGPKLATPRGHRYLTYAFNGKKYEKPFFSDTTRHKAYIFSIMQCLVVPFIILPLGSKLAMPQRAIGLHRLIIGKHVKIFFSETMRPRAFISCVKQCLVGPYIIPANRDPGVQIGHAPGRHYLPYAYNGKNI